MNAKIVWGILVGVVLGGSLFWYLANKAPNAPVVVQSPVASPVVVAPALAK